MPSTLPLTVLLTPIVIAITAVATMMALRGARPPRRLSDELGYQPDQSTTVSLTLDRYVGGHPAVGVPQAKPFMLLTSRDLALFTRRWGSKLFAIPWQKIEDVTFLEPGQMAMAAGSVRGLAPNALESAAPESNFLRVRFEDERGWWQNMVFEIGPGLGHQPRDEVMTYWQRHRNDPLDTPLTLPPP